MSVRALLDELREHDVRLETDDLTLHVDAPAGADTPELRVKLRGHKRGLIRLLEGERKKLEESHRRGLVVKWSREPGHVSVHDPTTGEWHELTASGCPRWVLDDARARRRRRGGST